MRGSRMTVQLASMGDAVMERPRRRDLARFHVRPRVRPVLGESPSSARRSRTRLLQWNTGRALSGVEIR